METMQGCIMTISKELLSNVLELNIQNVYKTRLVNVGYDYFTGDNTAVGFSEFVNIYELAHKCKEWLVSKGYSLHITYQQSIVTIDCMNKMLLDNISEFGKLNDEITPLIKICQFIYNKELKNDEV